MSKSQAGKEPIRITQSKQPTERPGAVTPECDRERSGEESGSDGAATPTRPSFWSPCLITISADHDSQNQKAKSGYMTGETVVRTLEGTVPSALTLPDAD